MVPIIIGTLEFSLNAKVVWLPETPTDINRYNPRCDGKKELVITISGLVSVQCGGWQ